uniref:BCNT-C domain-containing protein n=1 Tax=Rhabditophanes sp. KR3021 TaxID=114890 RepID=A0AC35TZ76_9BILA
MSNKKGTLFEEDENYDTSEDEDFEPGPESEDEEEKRLEFQDEEDDSDLDGNLKDEQSPQKDTAPGKTGITPIAITVPESEPLSKEENDKLYAEVLKEASEIACKPVPVESIKPKAEESKPGSSLKRPIGGKSGGLSSVASMLAKKRKKSSLAESAESWSKFKDNTGISSELSTFNRGKGGYLQKQDFLARTDLKQFEKEREARGAARKGGE